MGYSIAMIGVAVCVLLCGIGSCIGLYKTSTAAAGVLGEDPNKFGKVMVLVLLPATQGIYGFITMPYKPEAKFPAMWRNDTVEMFFAPELKKEKYFHLVFDAYMKHIENKAVLNPIPMPYGKWLAAGRQNPRPAPDPCRRS